MCSSEERAATPRAVRPAGTAAWPSASSPASSEPNRSVAVAEGSVQVPVEPGDDVLGDLLGARGGALADVGAAAEPLGVVLPDHVDHPAVALGLALGQLTEVG